MSKNTKPLVTSDNFGVMLLEGTREALAVARGEQDPASIKTITARDLPSVSPPPDYSPEDIRALRKGLHLSQAVFAQVLSTSVSTVQSWEQGKRNPDPMARRLIQFADTMAAREPETLSVLLTPSAASS